MHPYMIYTDSQVFLFVCLSNRPSFLFLRTNDERRLCYTCVAIYTTTFNCLYYSLSTPRSLFLRTFVGPPGWLSGERVGLMTWGCEFDPLLRRLFFPAYFRLSSLQKHVRKVVGGFGKKSCVSTGVRKPGNTYASPTAMI